MLFIAVFCGFLAENLREHNIAKKNTNYSLVTLYKDIQTDSVKVSLAIRNRDIVFKSREIIMNYYNSGDINNKIDELYLFDFLVSRRSFPTINKMALDELNSNGKLNFIDNKELKINIQTYYQTFNGTSLYGKTYVQKISNKRFFTSNDIALTARAGYGIISLNLGYSVTPVLRDGYGPSFNKLSVGLSISGL